MENLLCFSNELRLFKRKEIIMYYFVTQDLDDMSTMNFLGHSDESGKRLWVNGQKFLKPFPKDIFYVKPCIGTGTIMPDFFDSSVPLMSEKMVQILVSLGIDNFDSYPVIIKEENTNKEWNNYLAINFIGLVDAIDHEKSNIDETDDYIFHSVVIDENRTMNLECFYLTNGPKYLVVREKIAKALMGKNLTGIMIIKAEDYDHDNYF